MCKFQPKTPNCNKQMFKLHLGEIHSEMHPRSPVYSPILSKTVAWAPGQSAGCPAGAQVGTGGALLRQSNVLCWAAGAGQLWEPAAGASASLAVLGASGALSQSLSCCRKRANKSVSLGVNSVGAFLLPRCRLLDVKWQLGVS